MLCCKAKESCTGSGVNQQCCSEPLCEGGTTCCAKQGMGCNSKDKCCACPKNNKARINATRSGPPAQADALIQNAVEGISTITVAKAVNCTVANMPVTADAIKTPVMRTATKTDQTKPAQFVFSVCTPDGCCCDLDPIFTVLKLSTGRWARQTFADVSKAEHFLTVTNGDPGLKRLHIWINSKQVATLRLRDNETQDLDLAPVMTGRNNTVSLVGTGELGASAAVNIVDTPPAPIIGHGAAPAAAQALSSSPRHSPVWGPLAEVTEENSDLHAANVSRQTVQVVFSGALSSAAAANPKIFAVEVNGKAAAVQGGHVQGSATGTQLTLQLPQGTLHGGDSVDVYWDNLRDAKGRALSGHVPLFAQ
jgi:hypothetical protein